MIATDPPETTVSTESAREAAAHLQRELPGADPLLIAVHRTFTNAHGAARAFLERRYNELGLSIPRFNVLRVIRSAPTGRRAMGEISALLGVSPPNVTKLVDALERDGWLRRVSAPDDRRVTHLELTERGQADYDALLPRVVEAWAELWAPLTPEERATLTTLLEKLSEATRQV